MSKMENSKEYSSASSSFHGGRDGLTSGDVYRNVGVGPYGMD
jgi:hypothetical protein